MNKTIDFFDAACDLSDKNGFTGNSLDRLGEQRDTLDFNALVSAKNAKLYVVTGFNVDNTNTAHFDFAEQMVRCYSKQMVHL